MQGFDKFGEFSRALQASRERAAAIQWNPYDPNGEDLHCAEGMVCGLVIVLPFWMLVACAISMLAR